MIAFCDAQAAGGQGTERPRSRTAVAFPRVPKPDVILLRRIVLDMIRDGGDKDGRGLIGGFMAEISCELSKTRSSLAFFAAAAARMREPLPRAA